jgi:hypothetical protein
MNYDASIFYSKRLNEEFAGAAGADGDKSGHYPNIFDEFSP